MKKEKTITVRRQKIQPDRTKKRLCFFLFLTALLLLTVVFAEQICPYDPNAQDTGAALLPPGAGHLAGTDRFGRDMLSRILVGLKTSVTSTLILVVVVTVTGSILGLICGYFGGIADTVIMRIDIGFLIFRVKSGITKYKCFFAVLCLRTVRTFLTSTSGKQTAA